MVRITGLAVLEVVQRVEARGALDMAARVLESIGMVFRYAAGTGRIKTDVTQGLRQFLQERPPVQHMPHVSAEGLPLLLQKGDTAASQCGGAARARSGSV